jgi:geranyl-CoA carboxylase beta subunit
VVLVKGRSSIYLAGPPLVKAAIGEDTDDELGGSELHARVTGLGEYLAENDAHAIAIARDLMDKPCPGTRRRARRQCACAAVRRRGTAGHRPGRRARALRRARDHRAHRRWLALPRIQGGLRQRHGVRPCAHRWPPGRPHRQQRPHPAPGSVKAAQFIQLCDQSGTPLVFLQNTTGYMVGTAAERAGAIKHGSKMIQAVANARVPKFTIVVGGSFGAGNYGMCGRGFDPRFIFAGPAPHRRDGRRPGRQGHGDRQPRQAGARRRALGEQARRLRP